MEIKTGKKTTSSKKGANLSAGYNRYKKFGDKQYTGMQIKNKKITI